jgi:hypothetical protein
MITPSYIIAIAVTNAFILVGDSNTYGSATPTIPADTNIIANTLSAYKGKWVDCQANVHADSHGSLGYGRSFVRHAALATSKNTVAVIPCGLGSTAAFHYKPSYWRYRKIINDSAWATSNGATLAGMIVGFGPNDAALGHGLSYSNDMVELVGRIRADLDINIPVVLLNAPHKWGAGVHAEAMHLAQSRLHNVIDNSITVTTEGLTLQDSVHWDAPSQRTLGKRICSAMRVLIDRRKSTGGGTVITIK